MKKFIPEALAIFAIFMVAGYGVAQTWTKTSAPIFSVNQIGISADGKMISVAGSVRQVFSTNAGVTWNTNTPFLYGAAMASSADGTKLIGVFLRTNGYCVFISTNAGNNWTQTGLPATFAPIAWNACASSADGAKLVAVIGGGLICTSTDSGATWQTNTTPFAHWISIASSADGTKLAAVVANSLIYTSTNSGLNWLPTAAPSNYWAGIASSADGSRLIATGVYTLISTNSGVSWSQTNIAGIAVASSAEGSTLMICGQNSQIYTSTNFGVNWASTNIAGISWYAAASSADGRELVAGENDGIWIYHSTPSPKLNTTASSNNLSLSWTVPSTNFVLQCSTDLSGWTDLTNQPVLNLTNLQNQVALPSPGSNVFYRLKTP